MSNTQNFLTDNIEDIMSIADNSLYVGSSTSVLDEIDIITNYESGSLGNDINNRFSAIDSNFKRIVQSDYLRGAPGANYGSKHIYFAKLDPNRVGANVSYNNPTLYNPVIKSGGSDPMIMDNTYILRALRDAILSKCLGNAVNNLPSEPYSSDKQEVNDNFWNSQNELVSLKPIQAPNGDTINWHDNIASGIDDDYNVFTFIVEDQNGTLNAYSSLVYIFIDKRFEYITDANKDQYEGLVDLSCAIYFSYKRSGSAGTYSGTFESVQTFPTIEYNTDGNFYWKIYGSNSGLLAQGPKGDAASSAMIYCTYTPINGVDDYVILEKVLVTYIGDDNQETTSFMNIKDAVEKKYINLETIKNSSNHTKICAFCVPDNDPGNQDGVIMGTVCYTEDQNIMQDNDSNYIVRFNSQLSFNHLFNQHNFFNIMLENYNDGSTTSTENKFGALFIPMSKNSEGADVAAHTIYSTTPNNTETNTEEPKGPQKTLNILPVNNIKDAGVRNTLYQYKDAGDIDSVILADCPMNVYYDVNLINNPLHFKTSSLIIKNADGTENNISHNYLTEKSSQYRAKFDINYLPHIEEKNNSYIATPSLNINCDWTYTEVNQIPVTPKPKLVLNDLAVLLKFNPNNEIKHSVLDFISDLAKDEYIDNWIGASATGTYALLYAYANDVDANNFYLEREAGSINDTSENINKWNLNTAYCNYNPMILYSTDGSLNNINIYKTTKIVKDETISNTLRNKKYNNIYFYGNVYPYKRRIADLKSYTDAYGIQYKNYIDMYTYAFQNNAGDANGSTDFAQLNFKEDPKSNSIFKCPSYSLYRDYRSGKTLTVQETNANTYLYVKTQTKANESHPLDYSDNDNSNIASHEGGVVYPHKIILTNDANAADSITNESDLRSSVHQLNRTLRLGETKADENFENYGTCIAHIKAPTGTQADDLSLNNDFFSKNSAVKFDIKFDKLLAPIINIRSNAYTSPGTEFMRGINWNNSGLYLASFNTLNTGLAINKAVHSLSYRLVYEVYEYDNDGNIINTTVKRTSNIPIQNTKSIQNIQTGVCGNMRRVFFKDANDENWDNKTEKIIRDNAPMMGQLCDPTLMTRAAFPIALEDYSKQKGLFGRNLYSDIFSGSASNIDNVKRFGLNIHKNKWMYGTGWLYNGGNIATDNRQMPFGNSYITALAKFDSKTSRSNSNGIKDGKYTFKFYSDSDHCTPNDTLYNIGMYRMTYKDAEDNNQIYVGNDGYRTVTLPYYPGNISVTVNSSAFNKIPLNERVTSQITRLVTGDPSQSTRPNARVTGIEIMYNCEVVFDTLLDVISGNVFSDYYHWETAADIYGDDYATGLDVCITDAVPHSKFLKHNLKDQINRLYAPSKYDTTGTSAGENHIWDFRPSKTLQADTSNTLKDEECYSGYRGITYHISSDWHVDHTGAGYLYASKYDLDSYYNRAFINPYYYTANGDKTGVQDNLSDLSLNFRADKEINTYIKNSNNRDPRHMALRYAHTGLSLKPIDGSRNKISRLNKLFNHPPYFMGVGVINVNKNNEDVLYEFKNGNNKGIIYLCCNDDEAYATSNVKEDQLALNSNLISRDKAIILDDLKTVSQTRNPYKGFSSLLIRNNIDSNAREYMSPFFKTFGSKIWSDSAHCGALISDETNQKAYVGFNDDNQNKYMDALNIIDYWYPKSTDIFNNPFMFNNPQEINTNYQTTKDITLPNYSINKSGVTEQNNLSENFNLSNLKLAWRKFDIKNTSKGFYNGHTITYGELQDCTLSMLNIEDNDSTFTTNIEHTNFIVDTDKNTDSDPNVVDIYDASNTSNNPNGGNDTQLNTSDGNEINAHICNDGIIWSDKYSNYMAIRMTGDEQKYDGIYIDGKHGEGNSQGKLVPLAGGNVLPETRLYISKNGSKAAYQIDFITLLLAAGKYLEASGKLTDSTGAAKEFELIKEVDL